MLAGWLDRFEYQLMDFRFQVAKRDASGQIVVVEIDEPSLRSLNTWPWPRDYYAEVVERLSAANAAKIAIDVDFSSHSSPEADQRLEEALSHASRRVVLPAFRQRASSQTADGAVAETAPLPRFAKHVTLASVNIRPAADGLVRVTGTHANWVDRTIATLSAALAGKETEIARQFHADFGIQPQTIKRISFVDVLRGAFPEDLFEGRNVIVGATAIELGDQLPVPVHVSIPGPLFLALVGESLIQDRALRRTGAAPTIVIVLLLALLLGPRFEGWSWFRGLSIVVIGWIVVVAAATLIQMRVPVSVDTVPWLLVPALCYGYSLIVVIDKQTLRIFRQRMAVLHRADMMRKVVDSSFDGILAINHLGRASLFNPGAERMFGYAAAEIVGEPADRLFTLHSPDRSVSLDLAEVLGAEDVPPEKLEATAVRRDGTEFVCEVSIRRVEQQVSQRKTERRDTPRKHHFLTIRDVTARREMEAAQQAAAEEAISANRAKSELLSNMSHEFRTPLNHIIGFSELIRDQALGPVGVAEYAEYAGDILGSGQQLLTIVNDILDLAKIEAGSRELNEEELDLSDCVETATRLVRGQPEAEALEIASTVDPGLPYLLGNARAVKQILAALVSNAVKFTAEGQVIVAATKADDGALTLSVTDTGIGIAEEMIPRVTEAFFQVDGQLARKYEGTGLGLTLTRSLVELHGGRLEIRSDEERGTTVTCHFPPERALPLRPSAAAVDAA